uniref:DNA cytosine methyltransferase n=1 Tax=Clostridium sp. 12(A) TaxID=1163671 RepID=UPI00336A7F2F
MLELFGGIGSPRVALRNLGVPTRAIDYVEIDEKAVQSYNAMFENELAYKTQSVVGWNLRPDILIHGSPCQQVSICGWISPAGKPKGAEEGSGTESSLMWETIRIIEQMREWKPQVVIWENVKGVNFKGMKKNFQRYLDEMVRLGYTNSYKCLDARDFGIPQARERVFTISCLDGKEFKFNRLKSTAMRPLSSFLQKEVSDRYLVTQPSILKAIGNSGVKRATVIKDFAYTITERQDRCPAQIIDCGNGKYRFLTELECWRLFGYSDEDYYAAERVNPKKKKVIVNRALYKQAGNSIVVPIFEEIFRVLLRDYIEH